jgi:hypothetical protein
VKAFTMPRVTAENLSEAITANVHPNARIMTDEGFFSLPKRGINGTFHHVSGGHLNRYCDEFAFRYENRKVSDGH